MNVNCITRMLQVLKVVHRRFQQKTGTNMFLIPFQLVLTLMLPKVVELDQS